LIARVLGRAVMRVILLPSLMISSIRIATPVYFISWIDRYEWKYTYI
jgi:hypothetical protein